MSTATNEFIKSFDSATKMSNSHPDYAEFAYFYENHIVIRTEHLQGNCKKRVSDKSIKNLASKHQGLEILDSTRKRLQRQLITWISTIHKERNSNERRFDKNKPYPTFLTLTLPAQQIHPDKLIYRVCLWPFILRLKRDFNVKYYFWRAELQDNYNLHYHLIVDAFIPRETLQELWNHYINQLGYVDRFEKKHGHDNPPSTHIQAIASTASMVNYICKYSAKNEKPEWIDGRRWGMSNELKEIKGFNSVVDNYISEIIRKWNEKQAVTIWSNEFCTVVYLNRKDNERAYNQLIELYTRNQRRQLYDYLYVPKPKNLIKLDKPLYYKVNKEGSPPTQLSLF